MAQNENILTRLGKLFRSNIVVRKTDDNRLLVKDLDFAHTALTSNFVDRYNRLMGNNSYSGWGTKYAAKQNAIAAQGDSGTNQILYATKGHSNDSWHMHVTFIDQNNA